MESKKPAKPYYRIRDFSTYFFVAQNKKMRDPRRATWTPIPIQFTGRGYNTLMERQDGLAIFGAFILIVEVAARCPKPGVLVSDDQPMTPTDISRITRCPRALMEDAFKVLCSSDIRWIELVGESTAVDCATTALPLQSTEVEVQDRTGEDRTGEEGAPPAGDPPVFDPQGFPARLSSHLIRKAPELAELTPNILTLTVLAIPAYQELPETEWFHAADEFAAEVNGGWFPEQGFANGFKSYVRNSYNAWRRAMNQRRPGQAGPATPYVPTAPVI